MQGNSGTDTSSIILDLSGGAAVDNDRSDRRDNESAMELNNTPNDCCSRSSLLLLGSCSSTSNSSDEEDNDYTHKQNSENKSKLMNNYLRTG